MLSTSLISLADPNISCWIRSITAGINSENIWDSGSSAERYSDPAFLSEIASTTEWRAAERTWSWYPSARKPSKQFNQCECYGCAKSFLQRSTSSNLIFHEVAFNLRNEHFLKHSPHTIAYSYIIWRILLMWTVDFRIIHFPWSYFSKIRGRSIKRSGIKLDSRNLGAGWWEHGSDQGASNGKKGVIGDWLFRSERLGSNGLGSKWSVIKKIWAQVIGEWLKIIVQ